LIFSFPLLLHSLFLIDQHRRSGIAIYGMYLQMYRLLSNNYQLLSTFGKLIIATCRQTFDYLLVYFHLVVLVNPSSFTDDSSPFHFFVIFLFLLTITKFIIS